jgi:hypothetical protein
VQDCLVEGFETGILSQWIWGQTISRVTLRNCRKEGLVVSANSVAVEGLVVENTPVALHVMRPNDWGHWSGVVSVVGGRLTGSDVTQPAILNRGVLSVRDVTTSGFAKAIDSDSPAGNVAAGPIIDYSSHPAKSQFDVKVVPQPLEIRSEPAPDWETDPAKWLCANDFGAIAGDNKDDTAAIQKAIDEAARTGKTTVTLRGCGGGDPNWYTVDGEIRIHGSVRQIMGLGFGRVLGGKNGRLVVDDASAPVVRIRHLDSFGGPPLSIVNRSKDRTLVVESCGVHVVGEGSGDIFLTDCPARLDLRTPGQNAWCRQLNPEGDSDDGLVTNHGGRLWILGMKCEGRGVRVRTTGGGKTDVHGVFIYGPGIKKGDARPIFDVVDSTLVVSGLRELVFGGDAYFVKVREKQNGQLKSLGSDKEGGWIGWSRYVASPAVPKADR